MASAKISEKRFKSQENFKEIFKFLFQVYSRTVKALKESEKPIKIINSEKPKMIAIDLRTPEEIESQKICTNSGQNDSEA